MVNKMKESITKLMNTLMSAIQTYIYFNMYLTRSVFLCNIIELTMQQERILIEIYERLILKKLGLSKKFPKVLLCSRRSALGVRLVKSSTYLAMLTLKQHIRS